MTDELTLDLNRPNIIKLAEHLELVYLEPVSGVGFNMDDWVSDDLEDVKGHECGTTACIAGHAVFLLHFDANPVYVSNMENDWGPIGDPSTKDYKEKRIRCGVTPNMAAKLLGFSEHLSDALFYQNEISAYDAAQLLRAIARLTNDKADKYQDNSEEYELTPIKDRNEFVKTHPGWREFILEKLIKILGA